MGQYIINGSVYYWVTYSKSEIMIGQTTIWKHLQPHFSPPRGHWDNFTVNLGSEGRGLEMEPAFLSQNS